MTADSPILTDSDPQTSSPAIAETMRMGRRMRFNPLSSLTPASLTRSLDAFESGDLREAALLWDAIAKRDDTLPSVKAKREKSIAHKPMETVALEKSSEADAHRDVLEKFWKNVRYVSAWDRSDAGGVRKLIKRMQEAVSFRYAMHHIVWRPTAEGLRATFEHVPLWFFENREARLRFLPSGYGLDGLELDPDEWMISSGDGLMVASSIGYFCKRSVLRDWLRFSEKFSMPGVLGRTSAAKGSPEGEAMRQAARTFGNEWAAVLYGDDGSKKSGIELIQANGNPAAMPMPALIERVDRKISALYRGADLSTMSAGGGEGSGASLQGEEQDILERADASERSEELQRVERTVIRWQFGNDVEPLAQTRLIVPEREDQKLLLEATTKFVDMGARISVRDSMGRFGISEADEDEAVLEKSKNRAGSDEVNNLTDDREAAENVAGGDHWQSQDRDKNGRFGNNKGKGIYDSTRALLDNEGGFTISPGTGHPRKTGFAVAPAKDTERKIPLKDFDESSLRGYIRDHADLLMTENAHLGGWVHDGNVYLDVSIVVEDRAEALRLATLGDQIAFYDLARGEEINTDQENERNKTSNATLTERPELRSLRSEENRRDDHSVRGSDGRAGERDRTDQSGRHGESRVREVDLPSPEVISARIAATLVDAVIDAFDPAQETAANTATTDALWKDPSTSGGDRWPASAQERIRIADYGIAPNAAAVTPDSHGWYQIAPYGEWPTVDGKHLQVFGREQADAIVRHYNSVPFRITRWLFNNEVPVFIGHPDVNRKMWTDERKLAPKHKRLEAREDGLYGQAEWNALGADNLTNEYWQYPSPVWLYKPPLPGTNRVFPDLLQSVGLTNFQNTPHARRVTANAVASPADNPENTMKELIAELGLEEGASEEDILAAVRTLKQSAKADKEKSAAAENKEKAANAALETAQTDLKTMRETSANALIDDAVEKGSITLGEKPGWQNRFETDYETAANALAEVKPSSALNTKPVDLPDKPTAAPGTAKDRIAAVNAAVATEMNKNGGNYDLAHSTVKSDPKMKHVFEAMKPTEEDED